MTRSCGGEAPRLATTASFKPQARLYKAPTNGMVAELLHLQPCPRYYRHEESVLLEVAGTSSLQRLEQSLPSLRTLRLLFMVHGGS